MTKYEGMYIIHPTLTEEQIATTVADMNKIFTDLGAENLEVNEWGLKDLAYEIQDLRRGYYVVFTVECNAEAINEYNRVANIREDILRHIIIKL